MRLRTLVPIVSLLVALPALGRDTPPPAAPAPKPARAATKVFAVADLIVPTDATGSAATAAYRANAEKLVKLVKEMVRPHSWEGNGGTGKIEFFDIGSALVVENDAPDVLTEVGDVIEALRRLAVVTLTYEVRLVKAPAGLCERAGVKLSRDVALSEAQLRKLLEAAQADRAASVMQFPRAVVRDDEPATAKVGEEKQFVTGADVAKVKGHAVLVPKNTAVHVGEVVTVHGKASADGNFARVRVGVTSVKQVGPVELVPVSTIVTPQFADGGKGQPIPFTRFFQVPDLRTEGVERDAVVPSGGTLVVGAWAEKEKGKAFEVVALATVGVTKAPDVGAFENFPKMLTRAPEPCVGEVCKLRRALTQSAVEPRVNEVCKLRNVAAADAADALTQFVAGQGGKLGIAVAVAEPASNSVLVSAGPAAHRKLVGMLAELDKAPRQVLVQGVVLEVADDFVTRLGLDDGANVLSPREVRLMSDAIRLAKVNDECDILSRPQLQMNDGQTGYVNVGHDFPVPQHDGTTKNRPIGVTVAVTPRVAPDGKSVLLRAEANHVSVQPGAVRVGGFEVPVFNEQTVNATNAVEFGQSLCFVAGACKQVTRSDDGKGKVTEHVTVKRTVVILTPHLVAPPAEVKPAAGWFVK